MKVLNLIAQTAIVGLLCGALILAQACSMQSGLQEVEKVMALSAPFVSLIPAFVCPVDVNQCATVTALTATATTAETAASGFINSWINAIPANQPGALGAAIAGVQAEQASQAALIAAAQVKNLAAQEKISGIASSIASATTELLTLLQQAKANGGTTAALAQMVDQNGFEYDVPVLAMVIVPNPLHLFKSPDVIKLKSGQKLHTIRWHKKQIIAVLKKKTGDVNVDAIGKAKAKALQ